MAMVTSLGTLAPDAGAPAGRFRRVTNTASAAKQWRARPAERRSLADRADALRTCVAIDLNQLKKDKIS